MFWERFRKPAAEPAETAEAEAEASQRALRRLGRVVERRHEEQAEAVAEAGQVAGAVRQRFTRNAFFLLGVPMDADARAIGQAVDDLAFEMDSDPAELEAARAQLLAPRDRLAHELTWLPGCDAMQDARIRTALGNQDRGDLESIRYALTGLARVNLGIALVEGGADELALLRGVLDDAIGWDERQTQDRIDECRLRAGLREADPDHFRDAILARRREIARVLAEALAETRDGRALLGEAFDSRVLEIRDARAPLLEELARQYGLLAEPRLQHTRNLIDEHVTRLKITPNKPASVTAILTALDTWAQLRRPVQKLEQARGLDDPASAELFGHVRELMLELSNEHQQHDDVLRLARGLQHCFASVPSLHARVTQELPVVIGNVLSKRFEQQVLRAMANHRELARSLENGEFAAGMPGIAGLVASTFEEICENREPTETGHWRMLHQVAVALNNKFYQRRAACALIEWMIDQVPPPEINNVLVQDFCRLQPSRDGSRAAPRETDQVVGWKRPTRS